MSFDDLLRLIELDEDQLRANAKRTDGQPMGRTAGCPECLAQAKAVMCPACTADWRQQFHSLVKSATFVGPAR